MDDIVERAYELVLDAIAAQLRGMVSPPVAVPAR
jgi:hypothetical protein